MFEVILKEKSFRDNLSRMVNHVQETLARDGTFVLSQLDDFSNENFLVNLFVVVICQVCQKAGRGLLQSFERVALEESQQFGRKFSTEHFDVEVDGTSGELSEELFEKSPFFLVL